MNSELDGSSTAVYKFLWVVLFLTFTRNSDQVLASMVRITPVCPTIRVVTKRVAIVSDTEVKLSLASFFCSFVLEILVFCYCEF